MIAAVPDMERAAARHRAVALWITIGAIALSGPIAALSPSVQALLLAAGVASTGVPHGAVDHLRAAPDLRRRFGSLWLPAFVAGYVSVAAVIAVVWWLWPVGSLLGFLLLSVHHFGTGDARDPIGVIAHGLAPILVPCVAHPHAVATLFAALTDRGAASWADDLAAVRSWLLAIGSVVFVAFLLARRRGPFGAVAELCAVGAASALLPPLVAFAIYFCVWHAPRHVLLVAQELRPGAWAPALLRFARAAAVPTVATMAAGLAVAVWLPRDADALTRGLQVVFVGLAALTVPHLLVTEALRPVRISDDDR